MSLTVAIRKPASRGSSRSSRIGTRSITGSPRAVRMPYPTVASAPMPTSAEAVRERNILRSIPPASGAGGAGSRTAVPVAVAGPAGFPAAAADSRSPSAGLAAAPASGAARPGAAFARERRMSTAATARGTSRASEKTNR